MTHDGEPAWLDAIRTQVKSRHADSYPNVNGALRPAALLVLLMDSDVGPRLLLTRRAAALANYPGILVFPGGSADASDDGPEATALREAAEEVGIDPARVHVIGTFHALELPETRFLVTPVVGWSTRVQLTETVNPQEVAGVVRVPLCEFVNSSVLVQRSREAGGTGSRFIVDGTVVGHMTSIVIDALLDHSGAQAG